MLYFIDQAIYIIFPHNHNINVITENVNCHEKLEQFTNVNLINLLGYKFVVI